MDRLHILMGIAILGLLFRIGWERNRYNHLIKKNNYRSDLSREEMKQALQTADMNKYALFIPGDTSVLPYLIKR